LLQPLVNSVKPEGRQIIQLRNHSRINLLEIIR
jgi:hypothetical protein